MMYVKKDKILTRKQCVRLSIRQCHNLNVETKKQRRPVKHLKNRQDLQDILWGEIKEQTTIGITLSIININICKKWMYQ